MFMWRQYFKMEYCFEKDVFYSRLYGLDGRLCYNIPLGGDVIESLKRIIMYCRTERTPCVFCTVPEVYMKYFKELETQGFTLSYEEQTEYSDYLYLASDLAELRGRKYSGQRNQISKFLRSYNDWTYKKIVYSDVEEIKAFFLEYLQRFDIIEGSALEENRMVHEVLENLDLYRMFGGILRVESKIVGFSLGEIVNDTMFDHIEKADRDYIGAYQMIVNQTAKAYFNDKVVYINREEDMGDPGLRNSKQSYHPIAVLKKYLVEVK